MNPLRRVIAAAAVMAVAGICVPPAQAADYPSRPIRIVVPTSPGGTVDFLGRLFGERLSASLGQPVVIDNKAGSGGIIGGTDVLNATADGHTLLIGIPSFATLPHMMDAVPYRFADFTPIGLLAGTYNVLLVSAQSPLGALPELVEQARGRPGEMAFASTGAGGSPHLSAELFHDVAGITLNHIPFKGSAPAITSLIGGHVDVMYDNLPAALPHIQSGKVRALAVTSPARLDLLPDVPTFVELGFPDYEASAAWGLLAPPGTPPEVVDRLHAEIGRFLASAEVTGRLTERGLLPLGGGPDEYVQLIRREDAKWRPVIERTGLRF